LGKTGASLEREKKERKKERKKKEGGRKAKAKASCYEVFPDALYYI